MTTSNDQPNSGQPIPDDVLVDASIAACRVVWNKVHPGEFEQHCPAPRRWVFEELWALLPALRVLAEKGYLNGTIDADAESAVEIALKGLSQ